MWPYHPDLLAQSVPRYTSYPTAAEFTDAVSSDDMARALDTIAEGTPLSLYLHIPYCQAICWYCGCNTGTANRMGRLVSYLDRLEEEIALVAARIGGRGRIGRIAFGGGSPNAIAPAAFERLFDCVARAFALDSPVISIEIDPRGFTPDWAAALARVGVSRASLGVQTLDPVLQAAIGRVQPIDDIRSAVTLMRDAGVGSINFDLMYGLPGQREESLAATIQESLTLAPDRFAIFGYAHVPHLVPRQRRIDEAALPGARARFRQAALAHWMATSAGYRAVGFDHFALPGDALAQAAMSGTLRRNFQGFTEDQAEVLIGIGASAVSQFPGALLQNEKNTGRYHMAVGAGRFATARGIGRTAEDCRRGRAIEALLTGGDADLTGIPGLSTIRNRLAPFVAEGLATWQADTLSLADHALPYARVVAATLDAYRGDEGRRFSSAV